MLEAILLAMQNYGLHSLLKFYSRAVTWYGADINRSVRSESAAIAAVKQGLTLYWAQARITGKLNGR